MKAFKKYFLIWAFLGIFAQNIYSQKKAAADPYDLLENARNAMGYYRFSAAKDYLNQFKKLPEKNKENLTDDYERLSSELTLAENALERVERIVVIDSISVSAENFFEAFRLPPSAGNVVSGRELSFVPDMVEDAVAHINEAGDYILWSAPDEDGDHQAKESIKLLDGSWFTRDIEIDSDLIDGVGYPFVSQDGQTIYFSARGEGSLGLEDIYVVQRDPITGEFLNPLNIGMPFNSPLDDLMMVLDEENGIGWWVTGRWGDNMTVYVYLINDVRQNYPPDTDDIIDLAMISDYRQTWPEGSSAKISSVLKNLPEPASTSKTRNPQFDFPMGNGIVYHNYSDFKNSKAADAMKEYVKLDKELSKQKAALKEKRKYYSGNKKNLASEILKEEESVETLSLEVDALRSQVYKLEKSKR